MSAIHNEMILASAGSGKTYQLTNRYIGLMAVQLLAQREITPERIIAVTFTRKAAGEFFDSILEKLAEAAQDPNKVSSIETDDDVFRLSVNLYQTEPENSTLLSNLAWLGLIAGVFDKNLLLPELEKIVASSNAQSEFRSTPVLAYPSDDAIEKAAIRGSLRGKGISGAIPLILPWQCQFPVSLFHNQDTML